MKSDLFEQAETVAYELCKFCLLLQVYCQENHGGGRLFAVVNRSNS